MQHGVWMGSRILSLENQPQRQKRQQQQAHLRVTTFVVFSYLTRVRTRKVFERFVQHPWNI